MYFTYNFLYENYYMEHYYVHPRIELYWKLLEEFVILLVLLNIK